MSYKLFLKKLEDNKKYEVEASQRIKNKYNVDIVSFNNNYKYDFITSHNIKYEVKADKASIKTGNFFLEFECYNKPSGILTTEASYYIITDTTNYYLISVDKLKELINNLKNKKLIIIKFVTDEIGTTYGFIINKKLIIDDAILI
jgi:hypothetical protein